VFLNEIYREQVSFRFSQQNTVGIKGQIRLFTDKRNILLKYDCQVHIQNDLELLLSSQFLSTSIRIAYQILRYRILYILFTVINKYFNDQLKEMGLDLVKQVSKVKLIRHQAL
jgi:hypothetical protein